jgi:hypothetical protein
MPLPFTQVVMGALFGAAKKKAGKEQVQAVKEKKKKDETTGKARKKTQAK